MGIKLYGELGKTGSKHLSNPGAFDRNCQDNFQVANDTSLGELCKVLIWHDNMGLSPCWYLKQITVRDLQTDKKYYFPCSEWLSLEMEDGFIQKEFYVEGTVMYGMWS